MRARTAILSLAFTTAFSLPALSDDGENSPQPAPPAPQAPAPQAPAPGTPTPQAPMPPTPTPQAPAPETPTPEAPTTPTPAPQVPENAPQPPETLSDEGTTEAGHISLRDLPAPVRATIEREAQGAVIENIEQKVRPDGRPYYEVDLERNDQSWTLAVGPQGRVFARRPH